MIYLFIKVELPRDIAWVPYLVYITYDYKKGPSPKTGSTWTSAHYQNSLLKLKKLLCATLKDSKPCWEHRDLSLFQNLSTRQKIES